MQRSQLRRTTLIDPRTPDTGTGAPQGPAHYSWKGDAASRTTKRERAIRRYSLDRCERCGERATDRHHYDDDTGNNASSNIMRLCRRCHMTIDGRLEALREAATISHEKSRKPDRQCRVCGRISPPKRMWVDRCHRCHEYWRRHGVERPFGAENAVPRAELNGNAKITREQVLLIRASKEPLRVLVKRYGLTKSAISAIRTGRSWKSVR